MRPLILLRTLACLTVYGLLCLAPARPTARTADLENQPGGVHALFDLGAPDTGAFPSDWFTVADPSHNTGRRVTLPLPNCLVRVSDCEDLEVINTLDGFNLQPRLSIPFSGPIDVNSVTSETVFLLSLGSTTEHEYMPRGTVVGINQIVWDVETNTLHVESDELLAQHTRFALIVTNGIRDAAGDPVEASPEFRRFRQTVPQPYKRELLDAIHEAWRLGVRERDLVTASVFTTQSATAVLEKIRDQIHGQTPEPADFLLGEKGERTVFALDAVTDITFHQQTRDNPPAFTPVAVNVAGLRVIPGAVGRIAFGKYQSPDYEVHPGEFISPVGTRTGTPAVEGTNEIYFNLFLPSGPTPAEGWPVAIFGHGNGGNKQVQAFNVAASMAAHGIATVAITAVGHGFGPLGTLTVRQTAGDPMTFSAGGRGFDQNGDGVIENTEGLDAAAPRTVIANRDGLRQTVADLMQLVRVIGVGVDADGDGSRDLDPARLYYFGQSLGGMYGTIFLGVEPGVRAGVPTVPGGPSVEWRRLSPPRRGPGVGTALAARRPSLINAPGVTQIDGINFSAPHYHENKPLRNEVPLRVRLADGTAQEVRSPVVNTVAGAIAIQAWMENVESVSLSGDPLAYAPHLRWAPLPGMPGKSVIYLFGKGDRTVPNPTMTALLRAGELADRATFYRHDLAYAEDPGVGTNPHAFMGNIGSTNPLVRAIALGAQRHIAAFFASDGKEIICPKPARFFECPIQGPLPEELNFIPDP